MLLVIVRTRARGAADSSGGPSWSAAHTTGWTFWMSVRGSAVDGLPSSPMLMCAESEASAARAIPASWGQCGDEFAFAFAF